MQEEQLSRVASTPDHRSVQVRRFSYLVSVMLVVLCNGVLLAGLKVSGMNLDELVRDAPDWYDPRQDVCLRLGWHALKGTDEPVRLCSEWIRLSDKSGTPHVLGSDVKLIKGLDGQYYADREVQADYRLLMVIVIIMVVIACGLWTKGLLVNRYRLRLESADGHRGSPAQ